ncbi:hypothetical protein DE146DRAFT_636968 [Phaeosphaeria sp. MPI-PUGE-AT-0046c]|nr:hypothetical protein DE146DRAFT_636968 [Phaeosphaeria sp. MPI-PUGE-AT-0046c]
MDQPQSLSCLVTQAWEFSWLLVLRAASPVSKMVRYARPRLIFWAILSLNLTDWHSMTITILKVFVPKPQIHLQSDSGKSIPRNHISASPSSPSIHIVETQHVILAVGGCLCLLSYSLLYFGPGSIVAMILTPLQFLGWALCKIIEVAGWCVGRAAVSFYRGFQNGCQA